jgi:hypothetical protein
VKKIRILALVHDHLVPPEDMTWRPLRKEIGRRMPPTVDLFTATNWVEQSALSTWIREAPTIWAFPFILILHTVGMAFLVGTNVAVDARILGVGRGVPLVAMSPFFRGMWWGFWLNAASGVALLIGYPTKALTNPLFYIKLLLIAAGLVLAQWIRKHPFRDPAPGEDWTSPRVKVIAIVSLVCWLSAITAGRLLAYTYSHLMAYEGRY